MTLAFNLLQYPALATQRRKFHSRWTFVTGLLVGGLVAVGLLAMVQEKTLQVTQERDLLQSRLTQVQTSQAADKAQQMRQKSWQQQAEHVQALHAQHKMWDALHQALLNEASPNSVQLLRLQLDAQTLELHGHALDVQRMAQARERLSLVGADAQRDTPWKWVSLVSAPGADGLAPQVSKASPSLLEFVWQASWPQVGQGPAPPEQNPKHDPKQGSKAAELLSREKR